MAGMIETRQAIADFYANTGYGFGGHIQETIKAGVPGVFVGYREYDETRDTPDMIDASAPLDDAAYDEFYVPQTLPSRPLHFSVVVDETSRMEEPYIADAKSAARNQLLELLSRDALSGITDRAFSYVVTEQATKPIEGAEVIEVGERQELVEEVEQIALNGLTFLITDGSRMEFAPDSLKNIVAIKVNHPDERRVGYGKRIITLAGGVEINTASRRQVGRANHALDTVHEQIVGGLVAAGAEVVSIVAEGADFDVLSADNDIAQAVLNLQ